MARRFVIVLLAAFAIAAGGGPAAGMVASDPRALLVAMAHAADGVRDYTMTLVSQEWDGDEMGPAETLATKWARPSRIYYKRLSPPHLGREILFADGWNDGKLKVGVHAWPVDLGINLNPHGDLAMAEAKHPVDESSLIYLIGMVLEDFRRAETRGEAIAEYAGAETILGRDCHRIRILTAQSVITYTLGRGESLWDVEKKFAGAMAPLLHENRAYGWTAPGDAKSGQTIRVPRYYAARIDLWIDDTLSLPLRAEIYDDRGTMFERFEHRDLRVNVGLGPTDFSPKNPAYRF
jgi:outer membrane lipoprotein-sorting protein